MFALNKVMLIGYIGWIEHSSTYYRKKYGDQHHKNMNRNWIKFSVSTPEWNNKDKEWVQNWHNIMLFSPLSDKVMHFIIKGACVYVEGKLERIQITKPDGGLWRSNQINAYTVKLVQWPFKDYGEPEHFKEPKYDFGFTDDEKKIMGLDDEKDI